MMFSVSMSQPALARQAQFLYCHAPLPPSPIYHFSQYHVSFEPVQDATRKRIKLLRENIDQFMTQPATEKMIFDGAVLFLPATVRIKDGRKDYTLQIYDDKGESVGESDAG